MQLAQAYHNIVHRFYDPDMNLINKRAIPTFLRVSRAFQVLSDPNQRAHYDWNLQHLDEDQNDSNDNNDKEMTMETGFELYRKARRILSESSGHGQFGFVTSLGNMPSPLRMMGLRGLPSPMQMHRDMVTSFIEMMGGDPLINSDVRYRAQRAGQHGEPLHIVKVLIIIGYHIRYTVAHLYSMWFFCCGS